MSETTNEVPVAVNDATSTAGDTFPQKQRFRFNKDDTGFQRPAVELEVPVPSFNGLVKILQGANTPEGKKAFDLLVQAAAGVIIGEVRGYVSDNTNAAQENVPWDKFTFNAIANMPSGIRGVSAIAKELWEKFAKSYVQIMPTKSSATPEQAAARVSILVQKFRPLTGNPDRNKIIENLMATVAVYVEAIGAEGEEFAPILEFLSKKADELKAENTVVTEESLGF